MKLKPDNYFERQQRIARNRAASKCRSRPKHRGRLRLKPMVVDAKPRIESVTAPKMIGLYSRSVQADIAIFLSELRKACSSLENVKINFSGTEKVSCCGTLLMLAEIDRITRSTAGKCRITCSYPKDETVEKVFQQIGLLSILNKPHRLEVTKEDTTVANWRYASDISVNQQSADALMKIIRNQVPSGYKKLVSGVGEAMDNAVHHAYLRPRGDKLSGSVSADERRWWVFAEVMDGWLHIVFCDLGLGIPVTLPEKWGEQVADILRLTRLSPGKRDSKMIRRSLELGRTRTDQDHRGKGLKRNILKAAEDLGGVLSVYSNMGAIGIDYRKGSPIYTRGKYTESILGTVIQWSIPITETQDLEDEHDDNHDR